MRASAAPCRAINRRAAVCPRATAAPSGPGVQGQVQGQLLSGKCARKHLKSMLKQHRKNLCAAAQLDMRPEVAVAEMLQDLRKLELWQPLPDTPGNECQVAEPSTSGRSTPASSLTVYTPSGKTLHATLPDLDQLDLDDPEFAAREYTATGRILVCQGSKCMAKGALGVLQAVSAVAGSSENVQVMPCKCLGKCKEGAVMRVKQEGVAKCAVYTKLTPHQVPALLDSHFQTAPAPAPSHAEAQDDCCVECQTGH